MSPAHSRMQRWIYIVRTLATNNPSIKKIGRPTTVTTSANIAGGISTSFGSPFSNELQTTSIQLTSQSWSTQNEAQSWIWCYCMGLPFWQWLQVASEKDIWSEQLFESDSVKTLPTWLLESKCNAFDQSNWHNVENVLELNRQEMR